jgi:ketosteroid isomerase-like protein
MISSGPLEDRLAIRELVESYNDAVMRFDGDAWKSNWTADATWTLPGAGDVTGIDNIFPAWQGAMAAFSFVGFFASAGPIVVDGDSASATWYQQEVLHQKDGVKRSIAGKYSDDYVKRDGRWYFQKRVYEILNAEESGG